MLRHLLLTALLSCGFLTCTIASAENLCPASATPSSRLICLVPQLFGPNGFQVPGGTGAAPELINSFGNLNVIPSLNSAIASQAVLLPLASPSSGITYSWDPTAKIFSPSTDSFGPIYGERADTIGKYRVFLGLSYQYLRWNQFASLATGIYAAGHAIGRR